MSKIVWLMCGVPGSGKSYFAKNVLMGDPHDWVYISRDDVRYSLVNEDEPYFSKENEVFDHFIHSINFNLGLEGINNIIVDATHLNTSSRMKVLNRLRFVGDAHVIAVWVQTPLDVCQARNKCRKGRECVPENVIQKMWNSRIHPKNDDYDYTGIMEVSGV